MFQINTKDMSKMQKPTFRPLEPVDFQFVCCDKETDEFSSVFEKFPFDELQFTVPMKYHTLYGEVEGLLTFNKKTITFQANLDDVQKLLVAQTTKRDKDITEEVLSRFSFKLHLEDILFSTVENHRNYYSLSFFLFGLQGLDPPIKDNEDQYSVLKVSLYASENTKNENEVRLLIRKLTKQACIGSLVYVINDLMSYLLKINKFKQNASSFRKLVKKHEKHKPVDKNLKMICYSQVTYYEMISLKKVEHQSIKCNQHCAFSYKNIEPSLNKPTNILSNSKFTQLQKSLPSSLLENNWYIFYNPKFHGTSFNELKRRTKNIGSHLLLIKDTQDVIFGAFLEEGWTPNGSKYYGGIQSYVFRFNDDYLDIYRATKLNLSFQKCDENSICVGGEETNSIRIESDLINGTTNGSITFSDPALSNKEKFKIQELEIWCLESNGDLLLRELRLESDFHMDS